MTIMNEHFLIATCAGLLNKQVKLSPAEKKLVQSADATPPNKASLKKLRQLIKDGEDPLGEAFAAARSPAKRRILGAIYTPKPIVRSMMNWISHEAEPDRIIDPGAGSGRYILEAAKFFKKASLIAVEMDPLAALMLRTNLHVAGVADRVKVIVDDYRKITLPKIKGVTAFIGNPPYVRHHDIDENWKRWYSEKFGSLGIKASALAGLHLHFFLKTRLLAKPGDVGAFITSSEWMDVNYGSSLRNLIVNELGGLALHVLEPTVEAFPGTASTAAITCFRVGETEQPMLVRSVSTLSTLNGLSTGTEVARERFQTTNKWSIILRPETPMVEGEIELGELFRVHRGQVTGANGIWIAGEHAQELPSNVLIPSVTKAKDLIQAGSSLTATNALRRVIDIPPELEIFEGADRARINAFLKWARAQGAHSGYIASHRKVWWSVGLKSPAPILCTYMARRAPQFTLNVCNARHINIAHGLYPREQLDPATLTRIVAWLNQNIATSSGRTYAGGLTKFEPKEIERLRIPSLEAFAE